MILAFATIMFVFNYFGFWNPSVQESIQPSSQPLTQTDEQKIMQNIGPDATQETTLEHYAIAKRLAQDTGSIIIKECKGSPMVLRATPEKTVTVINQDPKDHNISLNYGEYTYKVEANSAIEIRFDFFRGKGFYGYGCDRIVGPAGILFVEE